MRMSRFKWYRKLLGGYWVKFDNKWCSVSGWHYFRAKVAKQEMGDSSRFSNFEDYN